MSHGNRLLFRNGVVLTAAADTPSVANFLEAHQGAYTTTRTQNNASDILFWDRHMHRLSNSTKLLLEANPELLFGKPEHLITAPFHELSNRAIMWDSVVRGLVNNSMKRVMPMVLKGRKMDEELAIVTLVSGNLENLDNMGGHFDASRISEVLDLYLHVGGYVPPVFGVRGDAARLAVVGYGRILQMQNIQNGSGRHRKKLEKLRPPSVTELLLSSDGDRILEGCLTNFFVVCLKEIDGDFNTRDQNDLQSLRSIEVQTAPLCDGVLPGVIRQVIRDICLDIGIPFREVAPSWSNRELWAEAFITNSLRLLQHVEIIQTPDSWESIESNTWEDITWVEKQFEEGPGRITSLFQREILKRAGVEAFPLTSFEEGCH